MYYQCICRYNIFLKNNGGLHTPTQPLTHSLTPPPPHTQNNRHPALAIYHLLQALSCPSSPQRHDHEPLTLLLTTCRQHPEALAAVVPYLDGRGVAAVMRGLRQRGEGGGGERGERGEAVVPGLALPLVVEASLSVTQVGLGLGLGLVWAVMVEGCMDVKRCT